MSEFVMMPKADYEAACNSIRAKTGKTELIKSGAMSTEIDSITGGGASDDVRYVTFMSYDGTTEYGKKAVAVGDDCADPIARGVFDTPTRESTAQYDYSFYGWATTPNGAADANWNNAVTEDRTVYANFVAAVMYYTIRFYDGETLLESKSVAYGSTPTIANPTKDGYSFSAWNPSITAVTGDMDYYAQWTEAITFAGSSWADIARIAEAGEAANYFAVGDTRNITCNGNTYEVEIVGIGCDTLSDGNGTVGISCMTTGVYANTYRYHSSNSNSVYWENCNLRTFCNETLYNGLETGLKEVVKEVQKISFYDSDGEKTNDFCWVPSAAEVGHTLWGGLGNKYPVFSSSSDAIINGKNYHLRDVNTNNKHSYYKVGQSTNLIQYGPMTAAQYIRFGFCI